MNRITPEKFALLLLILSFAFSTEAFAQTNETPTKNVNFRYSQNPKTRVKPEAPAAQTETAANAEQISETTTEPPSIAKKTLEIAKKSSAAAMSPTEIYRVGNGDVLFINLQNAPKSSTYFTVLNDGTIDYPLAGEMVSVAGLTTDEIEELLRERIKLYENPQISVKVREYASHSITVLGAVEKAGEKKIQREAVPLFVIRAEAIVSPKAIAAVIRRADSSIENIDLKDAKSENILIFPNDIVEFVAAADSANAAAASQFYFVAGDVVAGGQKNFHEGITLTQAIFAAGGTKRSDAKRIVIRRKNADNLLLGFVYNLRNIKDGKQPDPVILAGDTIEVEN